MADYNMCAAGIFYHVATDFTGVRAMPCFGRKVLGGCPDVGALKTIGDGFDRGVWWGHDHIAVIGIGHQGLERNDHRHRVADQFIHLPVPRYDRFAHRSITSISIRKYIPHRLSVSSDQSSMTV